MYFELRHVQHIRFYVTRNKGDGLIKFLISDTKGENKRERERNRDEGEGVEIR